MGRGQPIGAAFARMRNGSDRRRWRRRHRYGTFETWLRSCVLVLLVTAALWIGRTLQTRAVAARTPKVDPVGVVQAKHPGAAMVLLDPVDHAQAIDLIQQIWGEQWELGMAIAICESALQMDAVHSGNADGSMDVGLFQINSIHGRSQDELRDPLANTRFASSLFQVHGTAPWEAARPCWAG